jgi:hypothetical protein
MDLELLVKIEGEARRAVRALNLETAAKRGPTFAEVVARISEEAAGRPGISRQRPSSRLECARPARNFFERRPGTSWHPQLSMRMRGHLRGAKNEAAIARNS